jgi:arginyl-tRNA synthetase
MKTLKDSLNFVVSEAFRAEGFDPRLGEVMDSQRPDLCQFQVNGALGAAKALKRNPREIGQKLADRLAGSPKLASVKVEGPGFINIIVKPSLLAQSLDATLADARLGVPEREEACSLVLDLAGPMWPRACMWAICDPAPSATACSAWRDSWATGWPATSTWATGARRWAC